jgi:molecular chaperone IbpA
MFDLLENAGRVEQLDPFPPYDIEQHGEDAYRIRVAVAGYTSEEVEVIAHQNLLTVSGRKEAENDDRKFLYRGIAASGRFERRFQLAPHVVVTGANLADGILEVDLKREIPEAAKPRKVEIGKTPARRRSAKTAAAVADTAPKRQPEPEAA